MEISLLFKSTAGTSKHAAAGITEIIRHKRLIYIKMLINLSSHCPVRLRWPCVLHNISAVRYVLVMTPALCFMYYFSSFINGRFTTSLLFVCFSQLLVHRWLYKLLPFSLFACCCITLYRISVLETWFPYSVQHLKLLFSGENAFLFFSTVYIFKGFWGEMVSITSNQ